VHKSVNECQLQLDLFGTHDRRAGEGRDLVEARVSCSAASTSADRASDRWPALPHRLAAFSIKPASVQMARQQLG